MVGEDKTKDIASSFLSKLGLGGENSDSSSESGAQGILGGLFNKGGSNFKDIGLDQSKADSSNSSFWFIAIFGS